MTLNQTTECRWWLSISTLLCNFICQICLEGSFIRSRKLFAFKPFFGRFVETFQVQVKIYCYILQNSMNIEWYNGIAIFILPAIDFNCRKILTKKISNIAKPDVCISVVFVAKCKAHSLWATETPFFAWKNYGLSFALRPFFLLKAASYREPELELESSFR